MKEFKNIPSKIFWIYKNEKQVIKNKEGENSNLENEKERKKNLSMIEEYYHHPLIKEKKFPNQEK